jgi:hypothetical protein
MMVQRTSHKLFILFILITVALTAGCDLDEDLSIFTLISEQITGQDTLLYVSVRLERTQNGVFGADSEVLDDALVTINGDTLIYKPTVRVFQDEFDDLSGPVTISVTEGGEERQHQVTLHRLTVVGIPQPEDGPLEPMFEVSWNSPKPTNSSALELYQFNGTNGELVRGVSPITILLDDKYHGDSLRVLFYYDYDLPFNSTFEEVTYYLTQTSDVLVAD